MRREQLDELDDLSPPPSNLIRFCGAPGCRRRARVGGRHCRECHAAAVRRWRAAHRNELTVRRRDADALRDEDVRARDKARATLAMAIRRGKIIRGRCNICGSSDVIAVIADPAAPRDVVWICREDRRAEIERRQAAEARSVAAAAQSDWERDRAATLEAIKILPAALQARLAATAALGPSGVELTPEAPLYHMQLVRAYKARLGQQAGDKPLTLSGQSSEDRFCLAPQET